MKTMGGGLGGGLARGTHGRRIACNKCSVLQHFRGGLVNRLTAGTCGSDGMSLKMCHIKTSQLAAVSEPSGCFQNGTHASATARTETSDFFGRRATVSSGSEAGSKRAVSASASA